MEHFRFSQNNDEIASLAPQKYYFVEDPFCSTYFNSWMGSFQCVSMQGPYMHVSQYNILYLHVIAYCWHVAST